jgi:FkbM family methyltransferase
VSLTGGLSTARKIALARWLFRAVVIARKVAGRAGTEVVCSRRGVRWSLDLREGVQLALYLGLYERTGAKRLMELARRGAVVVDVGANIGAHTLPLASAVGPAGRVIAVEPTDAAFARLRRNCELNPALGDRVVAVHAALGAPGGAIEATYHSAWPVVPVAATRHPVHLGAEQSAGNARFLTLDDLIAALGDIRVSLIKIDVDGRELDVLKGAVRVLGRDHPAVLFELCPYLLTERRQTTSDVVEFFTSRGYELFDERSLRPLGHDADRLAAAAPDQGGINVIARWSDPAQPRQ